MKLIVDILVVTYNREVDFNNLIRSVPVHGEIEFRLLVFCNGEFESNYVRQAKNEYGDLISLIIESRTNIGKARALNRLMNCSFFSPDRGDFFAFMDDDDVFEFSCLDSFISKLRANQSSLPMIFNSIVTNEVEYNIPDGYYRMFRNGVKQLRLDKFILIPTLKKDYTLLYKIHHNEMFQVEDYFWMNIQGEFGGFLYYNDNAIRKSYAETGISNRYASYIKQNPQNLIDYHVLKYSYSKKSLVNFVIVILKIIKYLRYV